MPAARNVFFLPTTKMIIMMGDKMGGKSFSF